MQEVEFEGQTKNRLGNVEVRRGHTLAECNDGVALGAGGRPRGATGWCHDAAFLVL